MSYTHDWPPPRPPWHRSGHQSDVPDPDMRCSDIERTEVTNALCRHFGDGRLDEAEFNERMAKATAAKMRIDLPPLLADLPPFDGVNPTAAKPAAPVKAPHRRIPPLLVVVIAAVVLASALPLTFMAWHAHWFIIGAVVLVLLWRHDRHRRVHP